MAAYSDKTITDLIDGTLDWTSTKRISSNPKDPERFDQGGRFLQEHVSWNEPILLPLAGHLHIVQTGAERIIKCDFGHEFSD